MIRLILIVLYIILHAILGIILLPLCWITGKINPQAKDKMSLAIIKVTFRMILFISGVKTTAIGVENIPKDEPVLFVGNHRGFYDIIVSYIYMKRPTGYVAKKEMNNFLYVRRWMRNIQCLFLDRENMKEGLKTILKGIDNIKNGISVFIFPEGTRNKADGIQEFHAGSFKFAEKTNCKIIPVVQNNTDAVFERQLPRIRKAHTVIEFGKPIDITQFSKEDRRQIHEYTKNVMLEMYEKNKALV